MAVVLAGGKVEHAVDEPWDGAGLAAEPLLDDERIVGAASELDGDRALVDRDIGAAVNELAKQRAGGLVLVALADPGVEQAVEGDGHRGELEIDVDLERHSCGQGGHVEEVDRLGDGVLGQHAPVSGPTVFRGWVF